MLYLSGNGQRDSHLQWVWTSYYKHVVVDNAVVEYINMFYNISTSKRYMLICGKPKL